MSVLHRGFFLLLACGGMLFTALAGADTTIVIVRHGEKPVQGLGQLSCKGLNRSLALPAVLLSRYGNPLAIYAPNPAVKKADKGVAYAYVRPLATIEPLAIQAGLPVNVDWGMKDIEQLASQLLAQPEGTVIVAWEHHYGEKLARHLLATLGADPAEVPSWEDADFDSIFVIRITAGAQGGRHATFKREQQGLNDLPAKCGK